VGVVAAALEVVLVVAVASYETRLAPVVATAVAVVVAEDSKWVLELAAAMVASLKAVVVVVWEVGVLAEVASSMAVVLMAATRTLEAEAEAEAEALPKWAAVVPKAKLAVVAADNKSINIIYFISFVLVSSFALYILSVF